MSFETTRSRNQSLTIEDLRRMVWDGQIRIPEFQRSFRWDTSDVLALFDSILKGYPFGSFLMWQRPAEAGRISVGALDLDVPRQEGALWVVDGQQRITSLVNAVSPEAWAADERFRLFFSLDREKMVRARDVRTDLAIPLPDLFNFSRALGWLRDNPSASTSQAELIQSVAGLLNKVEVSAAIIEQADERVLREVFDRVNSRGRRLNAAEIFDAIHSSTSDGGRPRVSLEAIAERLEQTKEFGLLDPKIVVQALLVRRHPDITRDVHDEFVPGRVVGSAFEGEDKLEAYRHTETALTRAVTFLQEQVGIPHFSFLPFRFQLLVLVRFFGLFESPQPRNLELLARWVWQSSVAASRLGLTGSTRDVRSLAMLVRDGDEAGSVQRLLGAAQVRGSLPVPDVRAFRANHAGGKVIMGALWARRPVDPVSGVEITRSDLVAALEGATSPAPVSLELFPRSSLGELAASAGNRVLALHSRQDLVGALEHGADLDSLLLSRSLLDLFEQGDRQAFVLARNEALQAYLIDFVSDRTGAGLEATPPHVDLDLDDEFDVDEGEEARD